MIECDDRLWAVLDMVAPLLAPGDVGRLGPAKRWLGAAGVLVEAPAAVRAACPICPDGHVEEVFTVGGDPSGSVWISCPESLRAPVDPESLRRWTIRWDVLAAELAKALGLKGRPRELDPPRVWLLGTTDWRQSKREVVLAIGVDGARSPALVRHVGPAGRAIVLTTGAEPPTDRWAGRVPACVAARDVLAFGPDGPVPDAVLLTDRVAASDDAARHVGGLTLDEDQFAQVIRRQVRAAQKKELTDDLMVKAAAIHGSARKAEKALKDEGYQVHHSTISRAVKRHEDTAKLLRHEDSASVSRTVASQPRDRATKTQRYRN